MIATLDRKLLRDLSRMKMQALAVAAVLACGIALFVMATGMYGSLARARDAEGCMRAGMRSSKAATRRSGSASTMSSPSARSSA